MKNCQHKRPPFLSGAAVPIFFGSFSAKKTDLQCCQFGMKITNDVLNKSIFLKSACIKVRQKFACGIYKKSHHTYIPQIAGTC